jgi:hypothetical protein
MLKTINLLLQTSLLASFYFSNSAIQNSSIFAYWVLLISLIISAIFINRDSYLEARRESGKITNIIGFLLDIGIVISYIMNGGYIFPTVYLIYRLRIKAIELQMGIK